MLCLSISAYSVFAQQYSEYGVKAALFEKFARYIEWPEDNSFHNPELNFTIAIIGKDPFKGALQRAYRNERIRGKDVTVVYLAGIEELNDAQILFVSHSLKSNIQDIMDTIENKSILVITEYEGLVLKGSHINLFISQMGTVAFEINDRKAKSDGLKIRSILLSHAKIVRNKK